MYSIDLKGYSLAMALDSLGNCHKLSIGLHKEDMYFNSGVILFDLDNWNKNKCSERIINYTKNNAVMFSSPDQDLLNIVCKNDIMLLDPRYNMQPVHLAFESSLYLQIFKNNLYYNRELLDEATDNVVIYHFFRFLGEFPWNKSNLHPDNDIFDKYKTFTMVKSKKREI